MSPGLPSQRLYGTLGSDGFILEQILGVADRDQPLSSLTAHPLPMVVVIMAGSHRIEGKTRTVLSVGDAVVMTGDALAQSKWMAVGGQRHRLMVIKWSAEAYERMGRYSNAVLRGGERPHVFAASPVLLMLMQSLASPPPHLACLPVWYQAKVMEVAALALYEPPMASMETAPEAASRERAERAMFLLERDLRNPPTLNMLAHELGCGPFQLSRLFKEHAGRTIPKFIRKKRIEKAAQMLATSWQTVSDIVLEVGYESFSAFTRAFVREYGITPSQYRQTMMAKRGRGRASGG